MEGISQSEIEEVGDRPSAPIADDDGSRPSEHSNMAPSSAEIPGENIWQNKVAGDLLFWAIFHQPPELSPRNPRGTPLGAGRSFGSLN